MSEERIQDPEGMRRPTPRCRSRGLGRGPEMRVDCFVGCARGRSVVGARPPGRPAARSPLHPSLPQPSVRPSLTFISISMVAAAAATAATREQGT